MASRIWWRKVVALGGIEWSWDSRPSLKMTLTCGVRADMSAGG